jgi:hypothetical protein
LNQCFFYLLIILEYVLFFALPDRDNFPLFFSFIKFRLRQVTFCQERKKETQNHFSIG